MTVLADTRAMASIGALAREFGAVANQIDSAWDRLVASLEKPQTDGDRIALVAAARASIDDDVEPLLKTGTRLVALAGAASLHRDLVWQLGIVVCFAREQRSSLCSAALASLEAENFKEELDRMRGRDRLVWYEEEGFSDMQAEVDDATEYSLICSARFRTSVNAFLLMVEAACKEKATDVNR
ncbi:MAG TPA: hypothetical protein VKU82_11775 [Planctomycetaceae bacterium]|nr:hypothetical protein [Planctomycetaceae bacterium]